MIHDFFNQIKKIILMKKIKGLFISRNSTISNCKFSIQNKIKGESHIMDTTIGRYSYLVDSCVCNTDIGAFCSIASGVKIGFGNHPVNFLSTHPVFFLNNNEFGDCYADKDYWNPRKRIVIGNDVWLGANVFICDGVHIGNGVVVAAGAVVTKDIPPFAVVGGVPAKIIRYRFSSEIINFLESNPWYDFDNKKLDQIKKIFHKSDFTITELKSAFDTLE